MSIRVLLRSDVPQKEAVLKVESSNSVTDLLNSAAKALDIKSDVVKKYTVISASYGSDAVELSRKGDPDKVRLGECDIKNDTVVFLRAPSYMKPARRRLKKKKEGDEKEKKTDSSSADRDRYKGLTVKNIFKKFQETKDQKKRRVLYEFADIYASELVKASEFAELPKDLLLELVKSDRLNIKEVDLFEGVLAWAKKHLDGETDKEEKTALKSALADILPHIRFPCMSTADVATKVTPSNLLEADAILELFTYLGMKSSASSTGKQPKLGPALSKFNAKERKPRRPPAWFKWDTNKKHANLIVSDDGLVVTSTTTSYYQPVFSDTEIKENTGIYEWEIVLTNFYQNAYSVNVGVVSSTYTNWTNAQMIGYPNHIPGFAFACGQAIAYYNNQQKSYARTCSTGEVVRVRFDSDKRTMEYFINDQSYGVAFTEVSGTVRPAMSLYGTNTVTLRFPK